MPEMIGRRQGERALEGTGAEESKQAEMYEAHLGMRAVKHVWG